MYVLDAKCQTEAVQRELLDKVGIVLECSSNGAPGNLTLLSLGSGPTLG